jgi:hypothetical protein
MATVEDVSPGGIRLITARAYPLDRPLLLVPQPPHPLAGRRLPFLPQRCEALLDGHLLAGAFTQPLTENEVRALSG